MADPWADFADADDGDAWGAFPDAPAVGKPRKPKPLLAPPPTVGDRLLSNPQVVDGDTLKTPTERVRLWGVDAPELSQQGFDRSGRAVPIGQQSREWLAGEIAAAGSARLGDVKGNSYGRLVGPVTLGDGEDVGTAAVRSGNALAAPSFVRDDPDYRFRLMEAERLARLNGLGPVNDTMMQAPGDFRQAPSGPPSTTTIAQFFDTPTPYAGMRPEAEKEYLGLLQRGTADQIYAFGTGQGLGMDREEVGAWVADRDKRLATGAPISTYANYQRGPEVMQQLGDGTAGASARGFSEGFLAGGLGEAGAVVDMLGGTAGRENVWNSDRRLADIWAGNEFQNESILRGDEFAHPTASMVGNIAGGLTSGFVIPYGQGARTAAELAKVGAVYGGAAGFLGSDGGWAERAKGAVIGAPAGAVLNAGAGKLLQAAAPFAGRALGGLRTRLGNGAASDAIAAADGVAARSAGDLGPASDTVPNGTADEWSDFPDADEAIGAERASPTGFDGGNGSLRVALKAPASEHLGNERTIGMEAYPMGSQAMQPRQRDYLDLSPVRPRALLDPATAAERAAMAERVQPSDMLPIPSNAVDGPEEAAQMAAGRFVEAKAPHERTGVSRGTVRAYNGAEVPKVGPTDMVGWLRTRGGLQDQGGELSHMGLTNAARRGLDHVGQEARFGPLVNPDGDTLDDAAFAAWEAGYFPELSERPSVNEFLAALRDTHNGGSGRRFHPDDFDELERFDAMRGERYDLEQQQHEVGTVWQDRSVPADDAAPFPPVEAYEDWGSNAPDFAGNIRLDKLNAPQDIARALANTEKRVGFDAATRGRVTQAETERLAADLGMTADKLLSRRQGQAFNAEQALAARQILAKSGNELVLAAKRMRALGDDPGSEALAGFREKWVRHVAIQEQVSGMTAEAGRALQQFRQLADSREVRGNILDAMVTGGGGKKSLQEAADILIDAVESGPGVFNTVAEKAAQPKWRDKIAEWYVNALLGWPQTHIVNVTSNTLTSIAQIPEFAAGALIGAGRRAVSRDAVDRVTGREVGARAFGLLQGAKEGARMFAQALRTGEASDFASKVEGQQFKAIDGKLGEVVRIPTRFLTAEDELFKGIARRMELNGQAVRIARKEGLKGEEAKRRIAELAAHPTDEMFQQALDYGRYLTFQTKLGETAQSVSNFASNNLFAKFILPFVRTPTNLLKFAAERSPAAPLLREWRKDFIKGGASRDMAVARMMVGTGFGLAMYQAAQDGVITGSAPSDPKKAKLLYADGWKPYSVKIGDTYYSYKRLDPFSTTIGVAADMATLPGGMTEKQREDKATLLVASIMGNLASKTWLSGASSFIEAIGEPERYAGDFKNRLIASFLIPNVVGGTARSLDPVARKPENLTEELQSRIPGLKDDLLPRRDVWGRPIESQGGLGPDAFSPIWLSKQLDDPVNHELLQLDYAPGVPGKKVGGRELTPVEYDRYLAAAGKGSHDALSLLVTSPQWRALDDEGKVKAAKKAVTAARKVARDSLFNGGTATDEWDDFEDAEPAKGEADPWEAFDDAPARDVVADLQRAIPGIQFTSGFRSPAYNASLRSRGYHPADDSEHLDGSGLDMLPPRGMSNAELMRRVAAYDPKARLLYHDGHLHGGFNGYYRAPVLGGARAFGDRNPNLRGR